jgi:hypothetical protein
MVAQIGITLHKTYRHFSEKALKNGVRAVKNKTRFRVLFFAYFNVFHSSSLKPTNTTSSPMRTGLLINIPSVDNSLICSSSVIFGSLSLRLSSLYRLPLVLKNFFKAFPLFEIHSLSSASVGLFSFIGLSSYSILFSSSHVLAFLHVVHLL